MHVGLPFLFDFKQNQKMLIKATRNPKHKLKKKKCLVEVAQFHAHQHTAGQDTIKLPVTFCNCFVKLPLTALMEFKSVCCSLKLFF
jgi:hypothetical protein